MGSRKLKTWEIAMLVIVTPILLASFVGAILLVVLYALNMFGVKVWFGN